MSGIHHMLFTGGGASVTILNPLGFNGLSYDDTPFANFAESRLDLFSDGTWGVSITNGGTVDSGNWATPTTAGVGTNYWVRFTKGTQSGDTLNTGATATTGWLQLNAQRTCLVFANDSIQARTIEVNPYTVEISSSSGGTPVVSTSTIILSATSQP